MVCSKKGQNHKRAHTFQTYVAHRSPHTTQEGDFRSQTGLRTKKTPPRKIGRGFGSLLALDSKADSVVKSAGWSPMTEFHKLALP